MCSALCFFFSLARVLLSLLDVPLSLVFSRFLSLLQPLLGSHDRRRILQDLQDLFELLSLSYVARGLVLLILDRLVGAGLEQYSGELPPPHGGRDVQRCVAVLVHLADVGFGRQEDPRDAGVAVPRRRVQGGVAVVILDVGLAASEEQDAAGLVVAVLAGQVQGREAPLVLDVHVGFGSNQRLRRLAVALPRGLVQRRVAVLIILMVDIRVVFDELADDFEVTFARRAL